MRRIKRKPKRKNVRKKEHPALLFLEKYKIISGLWLLIAVMIGVLGLLGGIGVGQEGFMGYGFYAAASVWLLLCFLALLGTLLTQVKSSGAGMVMVVLMVAVFVLGAVMAERVVLDIPYLKNTSKWVANDVDFRRVKHQSKGGSTLKIVTKSQETGQKLSFRLNSSTFYRYRDEEIKKVVVAYLPHTQVVMDVTFITD